MEYADIVEESKHLELFIELHEETKGEIARLDTEQTLIEAKLALARSGLRLAFSKGVAAKIRHRIEKCQARLRVIDIQRWRYKRTLYWTGVCIQNSRVSN